MPEMISAKQLRERLQDVVEKGHWCMNRLDPSGELRAGFGEA